MLKTLMELRSMNLDRGHGATAEDIASCIGKDSTFDERVAQVSPRRFNEIMSAYTKNACSVGRKETAPTFDTDKTFKSISDIFLADQLAGELVTEALRYGIFRVPEESSSGLEKANKAKQNLMLYLIEMNSPDVEVLSKIPIPEPGKLTLEEFLNSKKEYAKERFSSYSEHSTYRLDRIFSYIRKQAKEMYEISQRDSRRRIKKGGLPLSLKEKIEVSNEAMSNVVARQTEMAEHIHDKKVSAIDTFQKKAQYAHTLTQKHKNFHKK